MANQTEVRKSAYQTGRSLASDLEIGSKRNAQRILRALTEGVDVDHTLVASQWRTHPAYVDSFTKGFTRRMIERLEFYLAHTED